MIRAYALPAMENVALWHERDISHSSVERFIGPDASITLDFALARLTGVIDKLLVYPERMQKNLDRMGGLVHSQRVLLALTQAGLSREDAYRLVQRNAMKVWESDGELSLLDLLKADPEVTAALSAGELEEKFDLDYHFKHVDRSSTGCSALNAFLPPRIGPSIRGDQELGRRSAMQIVRTIVWVLLLVALLLFSVFNWKPVDGEDLGEPGARDQDPGAGDHLVPARASSRCGCCTAPTSWLARAAGSTRWKPPRAPPPRRPSRPRRRRSRWWSSEPVAANGGAHRARSRRNRATTFRRRASEQPDLPRARPAAARRGEGAGRKGQGACRRVQAGPRILLRPRAPRRARDRPRRPADLPRPQTARHSQHRRRRDAGDPRARTGHRHRPCQRRAGDDGRCQGRRRRTAARSSR